MVTVPKLFLPGVIVHGLLLQSVVFLLVTHFFVYFLGDHNIGRTLLLRFLVFIMSFFIIISSTFFINL